MITDRPPLNSSGQADCASASLYEPNSKAVALVAAGRELRERLEHVTQLPIDVMDQADRFNAQREVHPIHEA